MSKNTRPRNIAASHGAAALTERIAAQENAAAAARVRTHAPEPERSASKSAPRSQAAPTGKAAPKSKSKAKRTRPTQRRTSQRERMTLTPDEAEAFHEWADTLPGGRPPVEVVVRGGSRR